MRRRAIVFAGLGIALGAALVVGACVGDSNNTVVTGSDGGPGAGADGSVAMGADGSSVADTGAGTKCSPCVLGSTKLGACCVQ
jgi:hypothetical protein